MLAIIGTVGVPACYGGFETLVDNLLDERDKKNVTVYCSSKSYSKRLTCYKNARLVYIPLNANGASSIIYDIVSMIHAIFLRPKAILILGVSGCIFLPIFAFFSNAKIITNIDGLEWKRDKWSGIAKGFLKFSEKIAVRYSDVVVADNEGIAEHVNDTYSITANVIAYGGDHAITDSLKVEDACYGLALCRIEPENNVDMILEGFSRTSMRLVFIGNWNNSEFGVRMKEKYRQYENIEMLDPIYNLDKLFDFRRRCSVYVHGHSAGGTNPSLVEMMHFNKNILAFDCNYNRASTEERAAFFQNANELYELINSLDDIDNANQMLEIAQRRYTWQIVKEQYLDLID